MEVLERSIFQFQFQFQFLFNLSTNNNKLSGIRGIYNGFRSRLRYSASTVAAASSSSLNSSGAEYYEQWTDSKAKQRRRKIAGVDQDELLEPKLLADHDSCFCEFEGVQLHYKLRDPESRVHDSVPSQTHSEQSTKVGLPMILLHGFGASVYSWNRVMKPLTDVTGSRVLAFDRPAFGLTSRVKASTHSSSDKKPLNPYSMAFSVLAALYFINFLEAEKVILVGHSAGSFVAISSYFRAPERVAALVLVAPAILAPRTVRKAVAGNECWKGNVSDLNNPGIWLRRLSSVLSKSLKFIVQAIMRIIKGMADMVNSFYKKALSVFLRSAFVVVLVRVLIDKFGLAAIRNAWYDSRQVNEHVLHGYTKPLRTKDWDKALVEFTAAMLTDTDSELNPPLTKRLHEISCPVLIVTGDSDRLVPSWNAVRLSQAIPGCSLETIKQCGHLPHEEKPDEFVLVVQKFLQTAVVNRKEHC